MKRFAIPALCVCSFVTATAQTSYTDGTGEIAVPGGPYPHLDIETVQVSTAAATSQITFRIYTEGDPTSPGWGVYMIGVKSGTGGAVSGVGGSGRPIHFPSGMTHWIIAGSGGGQVWTYGASWTQAGTVTQTRDAATKSVALTLSYSTLALSLGETFTFDVYTSGTGGGDGAVDALSVSTSSITGWGDAFSSTAPRSFTMPTSSDTDGDGLPDAWENAQFGNLNQLPGGDPDNDLLDNAGEYARSTDPENPDSDGDGLTDKVEDNSGDYAGAAAPGTSAVDADTDNDTHSDGAEVAGTALGFESNPLRRNFAVMSVPGNFNSWTETGTATPTNTMGRTGTSLTAQYQYVLDYRFTTPGQAILYKFAAGSWADNWGGPDGAGVAAGITATGIHRFTFDQISLAYTFTRPVFANVAAFLVAYDLAGDAGGDEDGDGVTNGAEFVLNSDPLTPDTDGDGADDGEDANPLGAAGAYETWIAGFGLAAADQERTDDPDGDGQNNLAEFLFGGSPLSGTDPEISAALSGPDMRLTWLGRTATGDAAYSVEKNAVLFDAWTGSGVTPTPAADQAGAPAGYTRYEATVPRGWCRIKATAL